MIIEQDGDDCLVTLDGETRCVKNCDSVKLAKTLWGLSLPSEKYTHDEMDKFGFEPRK